MKRSFGSLDEDEILEENTLDEFEPPKKIRKISTISQTDINQFYIAIAKGDIVTFDQIL